MMPMGAAKISYMHSFYYELGKQGIPEEKKVVYGSQMKSLLTNHPDKVMLYNVGYWVNRFVNNINEEG